MIVMRPTFSIIMPSFNYSSYVGSAIESVRAQTFRDWELLVVDDCSTDDSWDIIKSFDDARIKTHRHAVNSGACTAYNHALSMAQGDYIAYLDADDLFMPEKLERQAAFLEKHQQVDVCGSFVVEIDSNGDVATEAKPYADWFNVSVDLNDPAQWVSENHLCHSGAVIRSAMHRQLGLFDSRLIYTPDWQFWIRALAVGARFATIREPLVGYRNHGSNITHKNPRRSMLEHAETSAHILFPWLLQQGRVELIEQTIKGFIGNPELVPESDLLAGIAERIFSGSAVVETGAATLRVTIQQAAKLAELWRGKEWLETRYADTAERLVACDAVLGKVRNHRGMRLMNFFSKRKLF